MHHTSPPTNTSVGDKFLAREHETYTLLRIVLHALAHEAFPGGNPHNVLVFLRDNTLSPKSAVRY